MNVTVGIISYNQCALLQEAIDSILAQTARPDEIIIVDDSSTDDSAALIEAFATRHPDLIRHILLTQNGGPNNARNQIIDAAQGEYLSFLDGDDRWLPAKLEREIQRLAMTDKPDAVFSNFIFTDKTGAYQFSWVDDTTQQPPEGKIMRQVLTLDLPRNTLFRSEIAPTQLWREAGHFDTSFVIYGDWDMRIRLADVVPRFAYTNQSLCEYRRHGHGLSNKPIALHLEAVDHIEQKYTAQISRMSRETGSSPSEGLNRFRAKLLRRAAYDSLLHSPEPDRRRALRYYWKSLHFARVIDLRLFWYLLKA